MNHPLNNRGWSEVRDRLCHVLALAVTYLEHKIKQIENNKTGQPLYQSLCGLPKGWENNVVEITFKESTPEYNIVELKVENKNLAKR